MRKGLIGIVILTTFAVRGDSWVFFVPEEFPGLREGLQIASYGDTISYDPGLIAEPVNLSLIQSKGVVLIYRRTPAYLPAMRSFLSSMPDSGYWTGQARVTSPNSHYGSTSRIAIDSTGIPWVVWIGYSYDDPSHAVWYSRWDNGSWTQQLRVSTPEDLVDLQPRIAMDGEGNPWAAWHRFVNNQVRDLYFSRWTGFQWTPEERVNEPDSVMNAPQSIGYGGNKVWISWERGDWGQWGDILASPWEDNHWGSPFMVTQPPESNIEDGYPFDMAVDQDGRAHFVWTRRTSEGLFPLYRSYDGDSLSPIFYLNENGGGVQGDWPAITVDLYGNVHVVWTGIMENPPVNSYVFYRMYDGNQWTEPVVINRVDGLGNWRPSISAMSPDDIWVVWDGTDSTGEYHIYAVHYDGTEWSDEMRLDSDITNDDGAPNIALDLTCDPWVVWDGYEVSTSTAQVFYNRYISTFLSEGHRGNDFNSSESVAIFPNPFGGRLHIIFGNSRDTDRKIEIFDKMGRRLYMREIKGAYLQLNVSSFPSGVYFFRINGFYIKPLVKLNWR